MLIRFGTYNIRNGRNGILESVLRGMGQANVDVGVFQEKKLTDGIYTRGSAGYKVVVTPMLLFYRESPAFSDEAIRQFGANVIVCHLVMGGRFWYIFGFYLVPGNGSTIWYVEATIAERPMGTDLIFVGDLNVDLERMGGRGRYEEIAAAEATEGLEYISAHFLP